jgi:acetyl-CoA carboxylase biotin carboxyl carrier protein
MEQDVDVDKKMIDELIALMQRDGLDRLRVAFGELDLDLRMTAAGPAVTTPAHGAATHAHGQAKTQLPAVGEEAPPNVKKVPAPLVGVFYRAPAPGEKPFVEVGDEVVAGQVLCILEAMKLMNEIVSEHTGKLVRICLNDGQLVTLHQELFWIET